MKHFLPVLLAVFWTKAPPPPPTNFVAGIPSDVSRGSHCIAVGWNAQATNRASIAIGNNAWTSNEFELVIRFLDGTILRQKLPTNTVVDLRGMFGTNW